MKSEYLVIDACQYTANYNNCLFDGLVKCGAKISYATTVYPHAESPVPSGINVRYCYFYLARLAGRFTSSDLVRRIFRGIEYPLDSLLLFIYIMVKRIRVVHYMWVLFPEFDLAMIWLLRRLGCRIVYTAHNSYPHEFKEKHLKQYNRLYCEVDHIIALSEFTRKEIVKRSGVSSDKISVIPHGDYEYLFSLYPTNEELAAKVRAKANGRRVASFLGHIRPYKGLEYFVKSFPLIHERNKDVFFVIAGCPRFSEKGFWNEDILKHCSEDDCYIDLRFLSTMDMKAYLSVTDVLVQPYVSASQSGNTAMAYAWGKPVISSDVGGLAEMTEDGVTGYVVPPKAPQAISDAIVKCFQDDNFSQLSSNCLRAVEQEYSWTHIAKDTMAVYHRY